MTSDPVQEDNRDTHEPAVVVQPSEQTETMDQESPQPQPSPSQSLISKFFATDSSGSNENCGTYITCKIS